MRKAKGHAFSILTARGPWFKEVGILRFGAEAGVYPSGADRPTSMMRDDVYDSRKDLVSREDLTRVRDGLAK